MLGFYIASGDTGVICPKCDREIKKGKRVVVVQCTIDIIVGFCKGGQLHEYKRGEWYHQKCIGYGGYWRKRKS